MGLARPRVIWLFEATSLHGMTFLKCTTIIANTVLVIMTGFERIKMRGGWGWGGGTHVCKIRTDSRLLGGTWIERTWWDVGFRLSSWV